MKKTLSTEQALRYNRQITLPQFDLDGQESLLNGNILVVGLGGLGCAASQYLIAAGLGQISLMDDDAVDKTNLQRQVLHSEVNVGINKCVSAKQALQRINSAATINCITKRLDHLNHKSILSPYDLVLDCTDNLATRNLINAACYEAKIPMISGAAIRMEGQILCVSPSDNSACYSCLSQFFGEQNLTCVEAGVMSPLVGIIGAMQALQAIKFLSSYGEKSLNTLHTFDATTLQWQQFKVSKSKNCKVCFA
jgi:molybdopterin/thiamine biosynthesis adenylyltransferase